MRSPREHHLRDTRANSANDIEDQIGNCAESILHIAAEDPKEKHVSDNVKKASMQEHAGEKGKKGLFWRCTSPAQRRFESVRHQAVRLDESVRGVRSE